MSVNIQLDMMRGDVFVSEPSSAQLYLPLFQFKQSGEKKSLRFNTISRTTRCPSGDTSPALNRFLPIAPTGLLIVCILRVMQHASRLVRMFNNVNIVYIAILQN